MAKKKSRTKTAPEVEPELTLEDTESKPKAKPKATKSAPTPEQLRADAQARADACLADIRAACVKHRCRVVPYLEEPRMVGDENAELIVKASFGVVPAL